MEQKEVVLLGFRCENHNIIKVVELTPDIMKKQLIQIVGDSGNGKSSLLDGLMTAVHGNEAIKKKDALLPGFVAEVQLLDGDIDLFVGARKRELTKGQRQGEYEVETYLYAKDKEGNQYTPIIDGEAATPAKYMKLLTTELTFSMPAFFTENATTHRKLIESLFSDELSNLGADETVAAIIELRTARDEARVLTQRNGAYMEQFVKEGFTEETLRVKKHVDVEALDKEIQGKNIERDRIVNPSKEAYQLVCTKIDNQRTESIQKIKDELADAEKKLSTSNESAQLAYLNAKHAFEKQEELEKKCGELYAATNKAVEAYFSKDTERLGKVSAIIEERKEFLDKQFTLKPAVEPEPDKTLSEAVTALQSKLNTAEDTEVEYPKQVEPDTKAIDAEISALTKSKEEAGETNKLVERFKLWEEWIAAKGAYEVKVDELRRMYAKIDTGVPGLRIIPVDTNSDKVEVWLQYNGEYNKDFFQNNDGEYRYIFAYSSFQRSAIGVMLQAARLNLKPKALRLAIVDDVAFTHKGLSVLSELCKSLNVKLITSRTDDITKDQVKDGEVLMEGGVAFFKDQQ